MNSDELRQFVAQRARERCEYCLMPQKASTIPYQIDHIISKQHGGTNDDSNLALCCPICNRYKGPNVATPEPETGKFVGFFNPRRENGINIFFCKMDSSKVLLRKVVRQRSFFASMRA